MEILIGIIIGAVLGLTGAGGSVFAVPLLILTIGVSAHQAIGISLGAVALSAGFGVLTKLRAKQIQWVPAMVFAIVGSVFAPVGNFLNRQISEPVILIGFSLLVAIVAYRMWQQAQTAPEKTTVLRASKLTSAASAPQCQLDVETPFKIGPRCITLIMLGAILTGLLSGLFGVGGGFIIVPVLIFLTQMPIAQAVATSLVVITLISTSGFISFIATGATIDFNVLGFVAIGGLVGMLIGNGLSKYLAGPLLQKLFAIMMLVMAVVTLATTLYQ